MARGWGHSSGLLCEECCMSWTLGSGLGFVWWFWGLMYPVRLMFFQGAGIWWGCLKPGWCLNHLLSTGHVPSVPASPAVLHLNYMSLQPSPSRAAKKMACKATGNTRQPCLWVQCVMQCCLHWTDWCLWGRHLSVLPVASAFAAVAGITEDPNLTSKSLKCP